MLNVCIYLLDEIFLIWFRLRMFLIFILEWFCINCRIRGFVWWRIWFRNCIESYRIGMNRKLDRIVKFMVVKIGVRIVKNSFWYIM